MKKFLLAVAAIALTTASSAYAAPRLSASAGATTSGSTASSEPVSLLSFLISAFEVGFSVKTTAPTHKSARDPHTATYQCDEAEKGDGKDAAEPEPDRRASAPEPGYLAF